MRRAVLTAAVVAVITAIATTSVQAQAAPPRVAWHVGVPVDDLTYHPRSAGASAGIGVLWANGSATATVDLPARATHLLFDAWADRCEGVGPKVEVRVDGELLLAHEVLDNNSLARGPGIWPSWPVATYGVRGEWGPGRHHVSLRFTNDRLTDRCDRNLKFARIRFAGPGEDGGAGSVPVGLRQEATSERVEVRPVHAGSARPSLWSPGTLRFLVDSYGAEALDLRLWRACGREAVAVRVDGEAIAAPERAFHHLGAQLTYAEAFGRPGSWGDGNHVVEVELVDEATSGCDHQLGVHHIRFRGTV